MSSPFSSSVASSVSDATSWSPPSRCAGGSATSAARSRAGGTPGTRRSCGGSSCRRGCRRYRGWREPWARVSPRPPRRKHRPGAECQGTVEELPGPLSVERHALLEGRERHAWYRRGLFALVCVIPVLALLNVFGERPSTSSVSGQTGNLRVEVPNRLRGGLMYQA